MKKLLFVFFIGLSMGINAQESDQKKLMTLLTLMNESVNNSVKLDSISNEIRILGETTKEPAVKLMAPKAVSAIQDVLISNRTAKPVTVDFNSLDKTFKRKYRVEEDKFKKAMFLYDRVNLDYRLDPYISIKDNVLRLRLKTRYSGKDWLFFTKVQFIIDGKDYSYNAESDERNVHYGGVTESIDQTADENQIEILRAIVNASDKVNYRIDGKYSNDYTVSNYEKEHIKNVLDLYDLLTK